MGYLKCFVVAFFVLAVGCSSAVVERSNDLSGFSDIGLKLRVIERLVVPSAYRAYSDEVFFNNSDLVSLEDAVEYNAACVLADLNKNASRIDMEIINWLWVDNYGAVKENAVSRFGENAYTKAVEAYSNSMFDCGLSTARWLRNFSLK